MRTADPCRAGPSPARPTASQTPQHPDTAREEPIIRRFRFAFDRRFRLPLAAIGVRPSTCEVVVTEELLDARYGPLRLQTPLSNVRSASITGPYLAIRAIGPRGSMVDHGATFGTNTERGVCITFHEPVGALLGRDRFRHPGLTVTVEDPEGLIDALGLASSPA